MIKLNDKFTIQELIAYSMLPNAEIERLKQYKEELSEDYSEDAQKEIDDLKAELEVEETFAKETIAELIKEKDSEIDKLEGLLLEADKLNDELKEGIAKLMEL